MTTHDDDPRGSAWPPLVLLLGIVLAVAACTSGGSEPVASDDVVVGQAEHGRELFVGYGCGACHQISGVPGADGRVGPDLDGLADQRIIGGVLANTREFLAAWIRDPQAYSSDTGMPDVGVTEEDSLDIAAFLLEER